METKVLNYRIIVEPDVLTGSDKPCFLAYAPTLDVADNGITIEDALKNIQEAIECRIAALIADGAPVPPEDTLGATVVVTATSVEIPKRYPVAFS